MLVAKRGHWLIGICAPLPEVGLGLVVYVDHYVGQSDGTERVGNCAEIFAEAGWAVGKADQVDAIAGQLAPRSSWCRSL